MMASISQLISLQQSDRTGIDNVLWGEVMGFYATALAGDRKTYNDLITQTKEITNTNSIVEALNAIPPDGNGYRAWALAVTQFSASLFKDQATYEEINQSIRNAIDALTETKNGKMLANLLYRLAQVNMDLPSKDISHHKSLLCPS